MDEFAATSIYHVPFSRLLSHIHHYYFSLAHFIGAHEYSAMMTIAAWVSNEAIPGALPVWHP